MIIADKLSRYVPISGSLRWNLQVEGINRADPGGCEGCIQCRINYVAEVAFATDPSLFKIMIQISEKIRLHFCKKVSARIGSDGVQYSTFEYEYRVLALRIFEYEYWWLTSSTSIFFAGKLYTLNSVAGICCINWNHFS